MLYLFTLIPLQLSTYISISAHSIIITFPIHSLYLPLYTISTQSLSISLHSLPPHQHTIIISSFLHSLYLSVPTLYLSTLSVYISLYFIYTLHTHSISAHSTSLPFYFSTHSHYIYLHTLYTLSILYLSISIYLPSSPTYIILILLLYDLYITLCVLRRYSLFCRELEGVMIIVDRLRNS